MSIQKVKSCTCVETEFMGTNVACIDTERGLVLIDTPYLPDEIQKWKEAVNAIGSKRIAYVINTHHHFDHCLGNALLSPSVIAHRLTYDELIKPDGTMRQHFMSIKPDLSDEVKKQVCDLPVGLPPITFDDRMFLHLGNASFELVRVGGHTDSSIIVYFIEDRILFTGDVLQSNVHPYKGQANFNQWIEALEVIKKMDVDVIVPGHGEICDQSEVDRMLDYFQQIWDRVLRMRREGYTREEVIKGTNDLIGFYPIEPEKWDINNIWFDEGTARLFDEMELLSL